MLASTALTELGASTECYEGGGKTLIWFSTGTEGYEGGGKIIRRFSTETDALEGLLLGTIACW